MTATVYYMSPISLIVQWLTNLGIIAAGGQLNTYQAGTVSTPLTTYTDSTGLVPNANPMTLSPAGRPAGASSANVAFWAPAGSIIKMVCTDSAGNQLFTLDNIPLINDLTGANSLQTLLASPASSNVSGVGPVAGADLVANALKSYNAFPDVRAANVPVLASGQTLVIMIEGQSSAGDGLGGLFYWSSSSVATDDNNTILTPNSVPTTGRWLRLSIPAGGGSEVIGSNTTTDLGTLGTNVAVISGNTAITAFGSSASTARALWFLKFSGTLLLTNGAALLLPGGQNITTAPNDSAVALYLGAGNWQVLSYTRALSPIVIVKTSDQSLTNQGALQTDAVLVINNLVVGATYLLQLRLQLLGVGGTGQGYKVQPTFSGTLTGTATGAVALASNGAGAVAVATINATVAEAAISSGVPDPFNLDLTFTVLTGGTLSVQFCQNVAGANATVMKANSTMILTRVA